MSNHNYTASIVESNGWFIGEILEVPGALSCGKSEDELVKNLIHAIETLHTYRKSESHNRVNNIFKSLINPPKEVSIPCF